MLLIRFLTRFVDMIDITVACPLELNMMSLVFYCFDCVLLLININLKACEIYSRGMHTFLEDYVLALIRSFRFAELSHYLLKFSSKQSYVDCSWLPSTCPYPGGMSGVKPENPEKPFVKP